MHSYDVVEGPMLMNPRAFMNGNPPVYSGQQTSFHSPRASAVLENGLVK
jgi:hypothetical protein